MEKPLEDLSISALRNLLITEVNKFIIALDHGSTGELQLMKLHLRKIYDLILLREKSEIPLVWGKNSTLQHPNPRTDLTDEFLSEAQTA